MAKIIENWKIEHIADQLEKNHYRPIKLALIGLFLFDMELSKYYPLTEYTLDENVYDLYYHNIKVCIEADDPKDNLDPEVILQKENALKAHIPGTQIFRIDVLNENIYEQFLHIKNYILANFTEENYWDEIEMFHDFDKLSHGDFAGVVKQIRRISDLLFKEFASVTFNMSMNSRFSGLYINNEPNTENNLYAGIFYSDIIEPAISFVILDDTIVNNMETRAKFMANGWNYVQYRYWGLEKIFPVNDEYFNQSQNDQLFSLYFFCLNCFKTADLYHHKFDISEIKF